MQGVRGGEHLPAPAPQEQMQGVRGREHYSHQHFRSRHVDASRPGGARVSNAWCWSRPVTFHMTRVKHIFAGRRWTLRHRDRHTRHPGTVTHTLALCQGVRVSVPMPQSPPPPCPRRFAYQCQGVRVSVLIVNKLLSLSLSLSFSLSLSLSLSLSPLSLSLSLSLFISLSVTQEALYLPTFNHLFDCQ